MSSKIKSCSVCETNFACGAEFPTGHCWCNDYPPIFSPDSEINCMCPSCFHQAVVKKIEEYVNKMTPEKALTENLANSLPKTTKLIPDIDYYIDNGLYVFTAWYHLKRGSCCKNGCKNCPYGYKK